MFLQTSDFRSLRTLIYRIVEFQNCRHHWSRFLQTLNEMKINEIRDPNEESGCIVLDIV